MSTAVSLESTWETTRNNTETKQPTVSSQELLRGSRKITIDHEGIEYTLHLTRQNKLLLTK